jgi:hypothetical protein
VSVEDIISGAATAAGLDMSDSGGGESDWSGGETAAPEETTEAVAAPEAPVAETPAEEQPNPAEAELSEQELAQPHIPVNRHKAVLTRARREAEKQVAEINAKYEALKHFESPDVQERLNALEVAEKDPRRFAQALASDPTFAPIFQELFAQAQPQAQPVPQQVAGEAPGPDITLPDGSQTYSVEGLQKLLDYNLKQRMETVNKDFEERLKPFAQIAEERRQAQMLEQAKQQMLPVLEEARKTLPQFKENEAEMRTWLEQPANSRKTLHEAWFAVVFPKINKSQEDMRKQVLGEMNKKSAAVNPGPQAVAQKPASGSRTTEDIIREKYEQLSKG